LLTPLKFSIYNIRNPDYSDTSGHISIWNFDLTANSILEKNYQNHFHSFFEFYQTKKEIFVNDRRPIVLEVGTFSDPIIIESSDAFESNLTIIPIYFDYRILFEKNPISIIQNDANAILSLAVPQEMPRKRYIDFSTPY
jgi:hypothetical protein